MKINLIKAGTTYLSNLCAGDVFQVPYYGDRYFIKTDDGMSTAINLETGALYNMPDTTKVIFKKAILNVEE